MLFNMGTTLPLMATRAFHSGPDGYAAMMAAFGGGAVFGATKAGTGPAWPSGRMVRALVLATGVEVCLTACAPWLGLLYVGMALAGFLSIWFIAVALVATAAVGWRALADTDERGQVAARATTAVRAPLAVGVAPAVA
jgi:hypothetical protein